ncbi:MAG: N-acetylmuramoyl-L-alanine amidase [Gemmatimonadota bacterium]
MINAIALGIALQLAGSGSALSPAAIVIRSQGGERTATISIIRAQRGPMLRLEEALPALGAALVRQGGAQGGGGGGAQGYELVIGQTRIGLTPGVMVARVGGRAEQLPAPPIPFEGATLVPLALFSDVLPRADRRFTWEAATSTLKVADRPTSEARENPARAARPGTQRPARHIVVVDAGHGGPDRGMSGPIGRSRKIHEADITLSVARRLAEELRRRGVEVVMTRNRDTLISLADRGTIANRANGDLFISLHVNAANPRWKSPGGASGFETYFLSEAKTEDERRVEEMENEAARYEDGGGVEPGNPLSFIIQDMYQNEYLRESSSFAEVIQTGLARIHPGPNRGVKQAGFRVLVSAFMPAVLVELGFGSNPAESAYLAGERGQRQLAVAIAASTMDYLSSRDKRTAGSGVSR